MTHRRGWSFLEPMMQPFNSRPDLNCTAHREELLLALSRETFRRISHGAFFLRAQFFAFLDRSRKAGHFHILFMSKVSVLKEK